MYIVYLVWEHVCIDVICVYKDCYNICILQMFIGILLGM
jgi:hypothetical protein